MEFSSAPQKKRPWNHLTAWVHRHPVASLIITGLVLIIAASVATFFLLYQKPIKMVEAPKPPVVSKPAPITKYYSPLTGLEVPSQAATTTPVTAVMIENSPDARPQSGLKNSDLVFEAIAEAGITRFMVFYQQAQPQLIGPVRSLRIYDVDWLAAFNASIAHVGGSLYALREVRNGQYRDLDQFFNGGYYWRASDRYAPHNVYTSSAKLQALNEAKGYMTSTFTGFPRTDAAPSKTPDATSIAINFSSAPYNTSYTYDATRNVYLRSQGGAPHLDREDGQITPTVVIAMHVDETTVLQDGYREQIGTIGSGEATIFQNGTAIPATWHKTSKDSQIAFESADGQPIPLVRGQTWIAAVPNDQGSVTWQ